MDDSSQSAVGHVQAAESEQDLQSLDAMWQSDNPSSQPGSSGTTPTRVSPSPRLLQSSANATDTGQAQLIMGPSAPVATEEPRESETEDEYLPPHFVDIFAGRNRPISRAMEWCGWTTSSFEKFPPIAVVLRLCAGAERARTSG